MKKYFRKFLKVLLWVLGIIVGIILLLLLLIQIPAVQNYAKEEAVSFLEGKINTPVRIDNLDIDFPKKIVLEGFFFEDQARDTLLAGERLAVDINFYKLIGNTFEIGAVELEGAVANIKRNKDSVFNFDYIIEAFATDQPQDTTAAGIEISINTIDLDRIKLRLDDAISKTNLNVNLNHFDTRIGEFDPDKMVYEVRELNIDGLVFRMEQGATETSPVTAEANTETAEKSPPLDLRLGDINLTNINIDYNSEEANIESVFSLKELQAEFDELNLEQEFIGLTNLEISGLRGELIIPQDPSAGTTEDTTATAEETGTEASNNWKVKLNNADFQDLAFRFKDENAPAVEQGIDYMDLDLTNLNLEAEDFYYSQDSISGKINALTLQDHSGLNIQSLQTNFRYANSGAYLRNLYLETPQTIIREKIILQYTSLESLQEKIGEATIEADLNNSRIGFQDILLFAPDLRNTNPFQSNPNAVLNINAELSGKVNDLRISNFEASGIGNTRVAINGSITGLPEAETAIYDINIRNFQTTARDINQFVPAGTIPEDNIQVPERFTATGNFRGTTENFSTDIDLKSSSGNARVTADLDMRRENAETYNADVVLNNFDLGRLIQNDSLGTLTLNARVEGRSFNPEMATATASGTVERLEYNSYVYRDLSFDGNMEDGVFTAEAAMDDSNLDFDLNASGSFEGEYPSIQLTANLNNVALDSLNLSANPLRFEGRIDADLQTADPDHLNGEIFLTDFIAENAAQRFPLDSISIRSTASAEGDSLVLRSQFLTAKMEGNYKLTQIGPAINNTISNYYNLSGNPDTTTIDPQQFNFELTLKNDPVLTQLVPELKLPRNISISGGYNSEGDSLVIDGSIPRMQYLDYRVVNANFNVETTDEALVYELVIDDVQSPQIQLFHTELSGEIKDDELNYQLRIDDSEGELHYRVAGLLEAEGNNNQRLSLEIDNLILNYDRWRVPENNSVTFGPAGVQATNFELTHNNNALRVNSRTEDPASPIEVEFESFRLETLSAMISKDTLLAGGVLNGDIVLNNLTTTPQFDANLNIENFSFKQDTVGNVQVLVNNETANSLEANVTISGQGNDAELAGNYNTETGGLDFTFDLQRLGIESIQGFSFGNITEGSGYLSGELRIGGTADDPSILGDLNFNDVAFRITPLNSYFQEMNDRITFSNEGIGLNNFTIYDEDNNELAVNGMVQTTDYSSFGFNLTVNADNFRAINSTEDDNEFFYGVLIMDSSLDIAGTLENPAVRGSISIKEGTDFNIVLPQDDPTIADREGVVEFVDEASRRMAEMQEIEETVNTSELQGMDVSVNVDINEEAELTIVVDQGNGDFLNLRGEAQLTAGIDPSGKTSLTGRYEFTEGAYEMSFNFIRRRFEIEPGSYIQWTGGPTEANIDITAIYETETAPIDLLGNQLANMTQSARNTYKQDLPFQTILRMTGELLEPELSFNIRLPERNYNVSADIVNNSRAKLAQLRQQPSELNKQVFALLLLNRFIGENPFESQAGGMSAETMARQSVSKILSQQLNNLAGDLISGVELEFDLESTEDYTTGQREQRTDLNVGLSKRLLDDRLKVTVGSNFGIEGNQQTNQQANNIAGDIAVDYELSKDGRYRLRAYRRNQYEVALQGQIIETGVAFIITMDYNRFMEIFGREPDEE